MIPSEKKMDILISLCKRRGFIYPGSEIYGGFANTWDYGPYGVELKRNIREAWWNMFVRRRADMVGVDTPIIINPKLGKRPATSRPFPILLWTVNPASDVFELIIFSNKFLQNPGMTRKNLKI